MLGEYCKGYEVWGKLSQGGMSDVYLARQPDLSLPVIIKTLHPNPLEGVDVRFGRLLHEARLTARLTSPRVVRVIDVGVYRPDAGTDEDALPFLVEEYVDGIDLGEFERRRRLALGRPLPLWAVADQLAQAADGLHAAHQAGVVHRDVKPSNLFGHASRHVKVGDFGVAVASSSDAAHAPAGTPLFMAPEQLLGERVDRRSDVYGLGATGFALRYGSPPYRSPEEALRPGAAPRFPPPRSPAEASLQFVLAGMMAQRPDARYSNLHLARHHLKGIAASTMPRIETARLDRFTLELGSTRVIFEIGDLAAIETDAVVSSANSQLHMRSGVSDALRRAGGDEIEVEAMAGGQHALGDCVHTNAGRLRCQGVLHAVGGWKEVSCVTRAAHRALLMAEERGYRRIAMPAIATGRGRVSVESCADAMVGALRLHVALGGTRLREVRFVLYDEPTFARFTDVALAILLGAEVRARGVDELDALVLPHDAGHTPTLFAPRGVAPPVVKTPTLPLDPTIDARGAQEDPSESD